MKLIDKVVSTKTSFFSTSVGGYFGRYDITYISGNRHNICYRYKLKKSGMRTSYIHESKFSKNRHLIKRLLFR